MKEWCVEILTFMKSMDDDVVVDGMDFLNESLNIIICAYEHNNFSGLKMAMHDLNEMSQYIPHQQLMDLNFILRDKFGKDLNSENKRLQRKAQTIIKRGKIRNDDEFYQMKPFIDYLLWTGNPKDEEDAGELDRILGEYEQNSRPH